MKLFDEIVSVIDGQIISLKDVPDEIFSKEMMGKGIAIQPTSEKIYAPFDGEVVSIFPSKHAITLRSVNGCELLIHIGLDTVRMNGTPFYVNVSENDKVAKGSLLLSFDKKSIENEGLSTVIPLVILNSQDYESIELHANGRVAIGQLLFGLRRKEEPTEVPTIDKGDNQLERSIISALGGADNIKTIGHCATRLRVTFVDDKKVDQEALTHITGVLGVVEAMGGLQIVIGNEINDVYKNIRQLYHFINLSSEGESIVTRVSVVNRVLNTLSDILSPIVPLIMGSGLLSAVLILLDRLGVNSSDTTYVILEYAANIVFYFLPFFLAYTAAKRFKTEVSYSLFIAGLLLHPTLLSLINNKESLSLFGLPVTSVDYSSSLLPIILSVWILSLIEKNVNRYLPKSLRYVIKPLLIILIMIPLTLVITGPAGYLLGEGLGWIIELIQNQAEWLAILILCSIAPLLVMTGMHIALTPLIILANLNKLGYDNLLLVAFLGMNFSQFGVALATFLKTKNSTLRNLALSCAITAFLGGVTEPTLYGVTVKLKKPLYATFIGCFANAICCVLFKLKVFSFAAPSFFTLPIFMNPDGSNGNFIASLIAITVVIIVTFCATWFLGFDDTVYDE